MDSWLISLQKKVDPGKQMKSRRFEKAECVPIMDVWTTFEIANRQNLHLKDTTLNWDTFSGFCPYSVVMTTIKQMAVLQQLDTPDYKS